MKKIIYFPLIIALLGMLFTACAPANKAENPQPPTPAAKAPIEATLTGSPIKATPESTVEVQADTPGIALLNTPTAQASSKNVFVSSESSSVLPDDVLNEVIFFVGGGGDGGLILPEYNYCTTETTPTLVYALNEVSQQEIGKLNPIAVTCGWQENEDVSMTVTTPGGEQIADFGTFLKRIPEIMPPDPPSALEEQIASYGISNYYPVGEYKITFTGTSESIETTLRVTAAPKGMVGYSLNPMGLFLYGFPAGDIVRIIFYRGQGNDASTDGKPSVVWKEFTIGSDGWLFVQMEQDQQFFAGAAAVFSKKSGYVTTASLNPVTTSLKCGQALTTRIKVGDMLYLSKFLEADGLELFAEPNESAPAISTFPYKSPRGPYVHALSGPVCGENSYWWKVRSMDNTSGWVKESDAHSYFLNTQYTLSVLPNLCGGAFTSFLTPEQTARVTITNGLPLRVRSTPDISAAILGKLPEGARVLIMEGPTCDTQNIPWWNVQSDTGLSGWIAEGSSDGTYYLEPWK